VPAAPELALVLSFLLGWMLTQHLLAYQGIFGVPLQESIRYANVAISLFNDSGESYIYGYVPIVVAKCGVYLKEKGMFSRQI
jgi:hypothetical protein